MSAKRENNTASLVAAEVLPTEVAAGLNEGQSFTLVNEGGDEVGAIVSMDSVRKLKQIEEDRKRSRVRLNRLLDSLDESGSSSNLSEDEAMDLAVEEVRAARPERQEIAENG